MTEREEIKATIRAALEAAESLGAERERHRQEIAKRDELLREIQQSFPHDDSVPKACAACRLLPRITALLAEGKG